ncbi:hypothetical protein [Desmospora activa]|uniref:Uncharacterized protein n=1 Tax=Desmospora activa DSM 45169 TaxID=1121389 RepID=A0A2T4Z4N0_9BACL|nr:hypothetical protein [Desmospora activa]PTM56826.1 hypothetical protein C8J48_3151 [Desmospora activa DSM 45169]
MSDKGSARTDDQVNRQPWPLAGDPSAQEFRVRNPWVMMLRANLGFVPLLVVFYAIMIALGSLPFGGRLFPGMAMGLVPTAFLVYRLYLKSRHGFLSTVLRMSPAGVEWWDDYGFHVRLRWERIVRIGEVHTEMTKPGASVGTPSGTQLTVQPWRNSGLIGWGEQQQIPENTPKWVKDLLARAPRDPDTGAPEVAIPLAGLDDRWMEGPMGDWVRRYRPDLFSTVRP